MMFHVRKQHAVASFEVGSAPRHDQKIERFGCVLGEDHLVRFWGVDEFCKRATSTLVQVGCFCCHLIRASIDWRITV